MVKATLYGNVKNLEYPFFWVMGGSYLPLFYNIK